MRARSPANPTACLCTFAPASAGPGSRWQQRAAGPGSAIACRLAAWGEEPLLPGNSRLDTLARRRLAQAGDAAGRARTGENAAQIGDDGIGGEFWVLLGSAGAIDPDAVKAKGLGTGDVPTIGGVKGDLCWPAAEVVGGELVDGPRRLEDAGGPHRQHGIEQARQTRSRDGLSQHVGIPIRQNCQACALIL